MDFIQLTSESVSLDCLLDFTTVDVTDFRTSRTSRLGASVLRLRTIWSMVTVVEGTRFIK